MSTRSAEELRRFLEHVSTDRSYAAFLLAATTGNIYSHAIPALQESAAELVAALVLSAPPAGSP